MRRIYSTPVGWKLSAVVIVAAGCGRIGFGDMTCPASDAADATVIALDVPTEVSLCRGTSWFAIDVVAGARLTIGLELAPTQLTAATLTLFDPEQIQLAGPTWTSTAIESIATTTGSGLQLVRVDADLGLVGTLTARASGPAGRVLHIAPDGDDAADGSATAAWRTWPFALGALQPGDTLVVHDGTWTDRASCAGLAMPCLSGAAMPASNCNGTERSGTPTAPITIIAEHQRRAHLVGAGTTRTMRVQNCAWWIVDGLHGTSTDAGTLALGEVFVFDDVTAVVGRNLLADQPNRCGNNHAISVGGVTSSNVVIEDSEVYAFHRVALFAFGTDAVTFRRSYVHSRDTPGLPGSPQDPGATRGEGGVECYNFNRPASCVAENVIAENVRSGFHDVDSVSWRVSGSIARDAIFGAIQTSASMPPPLKAPRRIEDFVCVGCDVGIWVRGVNADIRGATLVEGRARGAPGFGVGASADGYGGMGGTTTWRNVLTLDNERAGFLISNQASWLIAYGNAAGNANDYPVAEEIGDDAGNIQRSFALVPTEVGNHDGSCLVHVPPTSTMSQAGDGGGPLGANVVYQVIDGQQTDRKLWNQRTGQFPCGAIVPGINDVAGASCFDVHERLRVGVAGCAIP
jgi:hypothetical protein